MKKIFDFIFSMKMSLVYTIIIAISSGIATFIENDFGTDSAKLVVYNALWFEVVIVLFGINLLVNIFKYKMMQKDKMAMFLFHISFIVIIIGAGITRYAGHEGTLHLREGESKNQIVSEESYLFINFANKEFSFPLWFSPITNNEFSMRDVIDGKNFEVKLKNYYWNATEAVTEDKNGIPYVRLIASLGNQNPTTLDLFRGEVINYNGITINFESKESGADRDINIKFIDDNFYILTEDNISKFSMKTEDKVDLPKSDKYLLEEKSLYSIAGVLSIVPKAIIKNAGKKVVPVNSKTNISGYVFDVTYGDETEEVSILGQRGSLGFKKEFSFSDKNGFFVYGSKNINLPFYLKLDDFILRRYPGSNSPSSYESDVLLFDSEMGIDMQFKIYMNHVLEHRGYRFYQSSYDQDEMGTILSVSYDPGKVPTYIGYIIMFIGFFWAAFSSTGRFRKLNSKLSSSLLVISFLILSNFSSLYANTSVIIDETISNKFARLIVQDSGGRIKPIDSLSMDVVNKLAGKDNISGISYNQIFLGMMTNPKGWQEVKLIKVKHPKLQEILKPDSQSLISFNDFFNQDKSGSYKLTNEISQANRKKPSERTTFDKEVIKLDEKANIMYMVFRGDLLTIFPNNKSSSDWNSPMSAYNNPKVENFEDIRTLLFEFFEGINEGHTSSNWKVADEKLDNIFAYQKKYANDILPLDEKVSLEILFNKYSIFKQLTPIYLICGFLLLLIAFYELLSSNPKGKKFFVVLIKSFLTVGFVFHTIGLAIRWYISGHAPWSDGYESIVYISWATVLAGFIFGKKSIFAIAATSILAGLALFVAHLSWLDPQITNLVPVLKSYWLTLHVSIISASYGFLALSALLGFITLFLFILRTPQKDRIDFAITDIVKINEMSMMVGLFLITIGNVLGAVWANESWGRYWSWDPKETWTLVSMLVYTVVLHFRFIPGLKSIFVFSFASVVAYFSVLMTYFGVNYFLSGLHSYAAGDPIPVPTFVPVSVFVIILIGFIASRKSDAIIKLIKKL